MTIDGWQLVDLVSVHGRGSLIDVGGLLDLAFPPVLFSVLDSQLISMKTL